MGKIVNRGRTDTKKGLVRQGTIVGDRAQQYSVKKRKDGFTDLIERLTGVDEQGRYSTEPLFKYIELTSNENKRGAISKRVTELYSQ